MRIGWFMELLPLGAIRLLSGLDAQSRMQNAPECQDPVTTRQDEGQTCWDVFAALKPSLVTKVQFAADRDTEPRALTNYLCVVVPGTEQGRLADDAT